MEGFELRLETFSPDHYHFSRRLTTTIDWKLGSAGLPQGVSAGVEDVRPRTRQGAVGLGGGRATQGIAGEAAGHANEDAAGQAAKGEYAGLATVSSSMVAGCSRQGAAGQPEEGAAGLAAVSLDLFAGRARQGAAGLA
ncbi:uncharacterized protein [Miscanthus floridulus]|uniref:uncharacterized protein n=1 Tax=Miscanthus floridulus TaxID=154761 RepID=UPI0034583AEF